MTQAAAKKGRTLLVLEYPTSAEPGPRHGHGRPAHDRLRQLLEDGRDRYSAHLESIRALLHSKTLADVPLLAGPAPGKPHWDNIWFSGLDAASLCYFLGERRPKHYVEVGSGMSTRWARWAIGQGGLGTTVTSIDPQPRADIEALCDMVVRRPLEQAELGLFAALEPGDVVFMDGSHRVFTNSDATVFLLDVVPMLPPGVLVGIHDILLPDDYPPEWSQRFYSEQYLLAAYLLGGAKGIQVELPCYFATVDPELGTTWAADWRAAGLGSLSSQGQAFWFVTTG